MSTAAKKQKNREYYLKNREKILSRARERNSSRRDHLEIVPRLRSEDTPSDNFDGTASGSAQTSEKNLQLSNISEGQSTDNSSTGSVQATVADGALALFDVQYEVSPGC